MPEMKVIACNYAEDTSLHAKGASCYYVRHTAEANNICVLALSRSKRWIESEKDGSRLTNFHVKTLPATHPINNQWIHKIRSEDTERVQELEELARAFQQIHDRREMTRLEDASR